MENSIKKNDHLVDFSDLLGERLQITTAPGG